MQHLPGLDGQRYAVIYADPPWHFATYSNRNQTRAAWNHYEIMSLDAIKQMPIAEHAADDCVLLLWAIDPLLDRAFEVIKAWNFSFRTVGFYWVKQNLRSPSYFTGLGYYTRANPETCLLATRGHPKRRAKDVPKLIVTPRREHSRKPDETITRIERLFEGPYLEVFARVARPGWDNFGDQVERFVPSNLIRFGLT